MRPCCCPCPPVGGAPRMKVAEKSGEATHTPSFLSTACLASLLPPAREHWFCRTHAARRRAGSARPGRSSVPPQLRASPSRARPGRRFVPSNPGLGRRHRPVHRRRLAPRASCARCRGGIELTLLQWTCSPAGRRSGEWCIHPSVRMGCDRFAGSERNRVP